MDEETHKQYLERLTRDSEKIKQIRDEMIEELAFIEEKFFIQKAERIANQWTG